MAFFDVREVVRKIRGKRNLREKSSWLLHTDNAPAYNAFSIREFLAKISITVFNQPPYSLDLYCTLQLFLVSKLIKVYQSLSKVIKGTHFEDAEAIKKTVRKRTPN